MSNKTNEEIMAEQELGMYMEKAHRAEQEVDEAEADILDALEDMDFNTPVDVSILANDMMDNTACELEALADALKTAAKMMKREQRADDEAHSVRNRLGMFIGHAKVADMAREIKQRI